MSFGIVRVQKMTSGSVKGIEIHDKRKKDVSHTNNEIDWSKSQFNYDLHTEQNNNFTQAVNKRIDSLKLTKAVRKDAIVMAQVLVTSDKTFFDSLSKEQQQLFFQKSYDFMANRYGKENIVSAVVHLDEKTPHMHFNFVPVTADGRLSAKQLFTKTTLREQQTAFYEQVGIKFGLERGQQGSKKKHKESIDFKIDTAKLELEKLLNQIEESKKTVASLQLEKNELENEKNRVDSQMLKLEKEKKSLEELLKASKGVKLEATKIHDIVPTKSFTGAVKGVSVNDIEKLKRTALVGISYKNDYNKLLIEYNKVKSRVPSIAEKMKTSKDKLRLQELEDAFERLPVKIKQQLFLKKGITRDYEK